MSEILGKDELSISVGGVDFTASKIAEMIRSHTRQNNEAAEILRAQMIELDRVKALLDEAVKLIKAERLLEQDRIFEGAGCPGFDGPMAIETKFDVFLQKLKGGV